MPCAYYLLGRKYGDVVTLKVQSRALNGEVVVTIAHEGEHHTDLFKRHSDEVNRISREWEAKRHAPGQSYRKRKKVKDA